MSNALTIRPAAVVADAGPTPTADQHADTLLEFIGRPGDSFREPDPSSSYAEKLHRVLLDEGVEHIVVTYQYHYYTHQYEEALGTRTAVVYRDDADSRYPWWLKDERTANPIWLPNGDLDKQLSFYCHRKAEVIEKTVYPARGSGSGKRSLAIARPAHDKAQPKSTAAAPNNTITDQMT